MKVGYYIVDIHPYNGGGFSLLNSIRNEIFNRNNIGIEFVIISNMPYNQNIQGIRVLPIYNSFFSYAIFRIIRKLSMLLGIPYTQEKKLAKIFKKEGIEIIWIPGPFIMDSPVPYIFTVWDLGHRTAPYFPEVSKNGEWENRDRLYKKMLPKASYIITGNETGRKEILCNYAINPEKIKVINFPNPLKNISIPHNYKPSIKIENPYIFYPAQFWPHKNHISLIEAVKYLHDKNIKIHGYFSGSDKGNMHYIKIKINEYNLQQYVHILGFVDENTLIYLYKNALALTFVSLLGPNNLPPIEAVSLGCPVIISDIPGHIEQMGDAALYVNATDPVEIGETIIKLLNLEYRNELIKKGNFFAKNLENYSYLDEIVNILIEFTKIRKTWQ